jgi:hypothetical protein
MKFRVLNKTILTNKNHYYITNCTKYVILHLCSGLNRLHRHLDKIEINNQNYLFNQDENIDNNKME